MAIVFQCSCSQQLKVGDDLARKKVKCPKCGSVVEAPAPPAAAQEIPTVCPVPADDPPSVLSAKQGRAPHYPDIDHGGQHLPRGIDFFAPPPAEIGVAISGYTTLQKHHQPWPAWATVTSSLTGTAVGLGVGLAAIYLFDVSWLLWQIAWIVGGLLVGLFVGFGISTFTHTATFVGTGGVASLNCQDSRDKISARKVFLFQDAANLWRVITHHYKAFAYYKTTWSFEWTDREGTVLYRLRGTHFDGLEGPKKSTDEYYLGSAAAVAWTHFLLARASEQLGCGERVRFALKKAGHWVELGRGSITFCTGAEPVTWQPEDIRAVEEEKGGEVRFKHRDMKEGFFSSEGVYTIKVHELANSQVFFRLLKAAIGFDLKVLCGNGK